MGPATPVCQEPRGIPECRAVGVRAGNVSAEPGGRATLAREQPVQACLLDTVGSVGGRPRREIRRRTLGHGGYLYIQIKNMIFIFINLYSFLPGL